MRYKLLIRVKFLKGSQTSGFSDQSLLDGVSNMWDSIVPEGLKYIGDFSGAFMSTNRIGKLDFMKIPCLQNAIKGPKTTHQITKIFLTSTIKNTIITQLSDILCTSIAMGSRIVGI